jgi:[FeFe] hydrogenase H-cluster maturation GTPase HydF
MAKGKDGKPHIGIFGRRNNGKSSLINVLSGQETAIVSEVAGTTTDPVKKAMEIMGLGPVILIDTAGIDDEGDLGGRRIGKSLAALKTIDLALLVIVNNEFGRHEQQLIKEFRYYDVPWLVVHNKSDQIPLNDTLKSKLEANYQVPVIEFSVTQNDNPAAIVNAIRRLMPESAYKSVSLLGDIVAGGDLVMLITPVDSEAPEGRLILPQVQAIRDILDNDAIAVVVKEHEVDDLIARLKPKPALVVTDSQVFRKADASIPQDIPLTSFSIMLARRKGAFEDYLKGTPKLSQLQHGDKVLILESCTHEVTCDDIGRVKIPEWLSQFTGKKLDFLVVSGLNDLPDDIHSYAMVIQCGGCVITQKQILNRLKPAIDAGLPVTNYGMAIAYMQGVYQRAIAPFVKNENKSINHLSNPN